MPDTFSDEEIALVRERYQQLKRTGPGVVEGILTMQAVYDGERIDENFQVKITAQNPNSHRIPALYETGGRTKAIAEKYAIVDLRALHYNPNDETACVCVRQEEKYKYPPGSDLLTFIENLAVPYLYGLTFYDQHQRWPWGDYAHGSLGLLEFYADEPIEQNEEDVNDVLTAIRKEINWKDYHKQIRNPNEKKACVCGSGKPFGTCHEKVCAGLNHLRGELNRLGMNLKTLF